MGLLSRLKETLVSWGDDSDPPVRTETYPLHAFGKLPVYKDFISSGLADDPSREFRDWLSTGFSHKWAAREDFKETEIPFHSFLLRLPQSKKMVAGVLFGSSDQGSLRKFPFVLFSVLPAGGTTANPLTALDYLVEFERRGEEIRRNYGSGSSAGTLAAFYEEYRGKKISLPVRSFDQVYAKLAHRLKSTTVEKFAEELLGDAAAKGWTRFLSAFSEHAGPDGAGACRLPLGHDSSPVFQLSFWLLWLRKRDVKGGPLVTGFLFQNARQIPRAVLFFRDLRAEDFLLLHPTERDYDYVEELVTAPKAADGPKPEEEAAAEAPAAPAPAVVPAAGPGATPLAGADAEGAVPVPEKTAPPAPAAAPADARADDDDELPDEWRYSLTSLLEGSR